MINKKIASELAVGIILLIALAMGGIFWMDQGDIQQAVDNNLEQTNDNLELKKENIKLSETSRKYDTVIIYSEEVKTTEDESRSWPTVRIYRKIGKQQPEILAEVGKVGEYPNSYKLSPDRKNLLINLESKLQVLNLETKELSDLFLPKKEILDVSYSPDGKKLFVWDQKYGGDEKDYFAHILDLEIKKDKIIAQGENSFNFLFPGVWRDDNKVTLAEAFGEFSLPHYFDLSDNKIVKVSEIPQVGYLSESGKVMVVSISDVDDLCNDFSLTAPSIYNVVDPINGKNFGKVGVEGKIAVILAISPKDDEILLKAGNPWVNKEDCDKEIFYDFYKANISSGKIEKVNNISELLKAWDTEYVGAYYSYNKVRNIFLNGEVLVKSDKDLSLIAQFYN